MHDDTDDTESIAQAFRPNRAPLVFAVAANVVLAALFLGVPYLRGHLQAQDSLRAFARFSGCMLGGKPRTELGLALPPGDRAHFAAQVMHAKPDWPERCRAPLRAVAPEEAIFLWPSIKLADADVRAATQLLDRELAALSRARSAGRAARIPTRPLLLLSKLQGMLTLLAHAASADAALDRDAVTFAAGADVIDPSRLPLVAGASAALEVWGGGGDGLQAIAADPGGVSWLKLDGGKVGRIRVRRTSLVRGALRDMGRPLLVWAMPEQRCAQQDTRCVQRATGLAYLDENAIMLPKPTWIAGHPGSRFDRSVRVSLGVRVDLLARASAEGALEVRRFELKPAAPPADAAAAGEQAPPVGALEHFALPEGVLPSDALLLSGQPAVVAYATVTAGDAPTMEAWLLAYESGAAPLSVGTAHGAGGFVEACESDGVRWIAYGTETALGLARIADGAVSAPLPAAPLALGALLPRDESRRDRVRIACTKERASVLALAADKTLSILRCDSTRCARGAVAADVATFDFTPSGDDVIVGYARSSQPQIELARLDASGAVSGPRETPAPCWDPLGGMCGQPTLVSAPGRLLLCARDGSDLLALESEDGGKRWKPLRSLQQSAPPGGDASAPMQQHRIRKGLD